MNAILATVRSALPSFEVRFMSLVRHGSGFTFPCDGQGHVDLDALSDRARNNYLYARAMVGRDIGLPCVSELSGAEFAAQH
jgi:hypothetical protein